ncbi:MAG TPA: hypothetical protein VMU24_13990 [Candidatus Acidoferrales bacterium]|nr:hypothetical protein [Candidatus Acidoferrales bacterium]
MHKLFSAFLLMSSLYAAGHAQSAQSNLPPVRQIAQIELPGLPGFDELALAKGMVIITHPAANTVDIFDPQKRRLIGHVEGMSAPRGISVDEANQRVYIANTGANNLVVISTEDWQVKTLVPLNGSPESLLVVPSAQRLYITLPEKESVAAVDLHTAHEINAVTMSGRPESMAWDSKRMRLAVTLQDRKQVALLTPELQLAGSFALNGSMPTSLVYDEQQDRYFLAIRYAVLELNAEDGAEIARMPAAGGIDQLWLDRQERALYGVANGSFFVMSAGSRLGSPRELDLDVKGHTLAFDPQRKLIYVPGGREGRSKLLILHRIGAEQPEGTGSAVASK